MKKGVSDSRKVTDARITAEGDGGVASRLPVVDVVSGVDGGVRRLHEDCKFSVKWQRTSSGLQRLLLTCQESKCQRSAIFSGR